MPLYIYKCNHCDFEDEVLQNIGTNKLDCAKCGFSMNKIPTAHAFIYMKGYPSFRRRYLGTAPYTTKPNPSELKGGPGSKLPLAKIEGEKWLESIE